MLPCYSCKNRRSIPGDTHSQCIFEWQGLPTENIPVHQGGPRTHQWFRFPLNYDPVWGPDECPAFDSKESLLKFVTKNRE